MANGAPDDGKDDKPTANPHADEMALSERLTRLDRELSVARKDRGNRGGGQTGDQGERAAASASAMARGFRLSSELVAGVVVGGVIGWGFDRLLSTSPWGLIVFFLLGFTAGVINVMRAAGVAPGRKLD